MKNILISLVAIGSLSFAGSGNLIPKSPIIPIAEEEEVSFYIGAGVSNFNLNDDISKEEFSSYLGTVIGGININDYIGLEGRYYRSFGDMEYDKGKTSNQNFTDYPGTFTDYSVFLKARTQFQSFEPYILLGYGEVEFDSLPYVSGVSKRTEAGLQYGLGASYYFTDKIATFIDYSILYNDKGFDGRAEKADIKADVLTFGFTYTF